MEQLTKEEAIEFFSKFYRGAHHIPGKDCAPKEWGDGWAVNHDRGSLSTYDFSELTQLVILAHDNCIRVSVMPCSNRILKIAIWKRESGNENISLGHPALENHIVKLREYLNRK